MAAVIFPAGSNKLDWIPNPSKLEKTAQEEVKEGEEIVEIDQIDSDPQFDAIKNLPGFADEAKALDEDVTNVSEDGDKEGIAEEVAEAAEAAKEAVDKVVEKVDQAINISEDKKDDKSSDKEDKEVEEVEVEVEDDGDKKEDEEVEIEIEDDDKKEDEEVVLEIEFEKPEDEVPGGTVGIDEKKEGKEEGEMESKDESKSACASVGEKFVKISKLNPQNRKDLYDYWTGLGFPVEYVKAMLQDY